MLNQRVLEKLHTQDIARNYGFEDSEIFDEDCALRVVAPAFVLLPQEEEEPDEDELEEKLQPKELDFNRGWIS